MSTPGNPYNYNRTNANSQATPIVFTVDLQDASEAAFTAFAKERAHRQGVKIDFHTPTAANTTAFEVFGYGFDVVTLHKELTDEIKVKGWLNGAGGAAAAITSSVDLTVLRFH